ncbi:hypothetical protein [Endozoicomonas sp. GU-1]|uniref:hypothetical protein n=1 Tax=Endozoicomonas sp. GU-1 TaxID=3009078 RepID=UPI0022B4EAE1|nr:hypothetical protein [Endozoicomonas sp. GU-1]WBA81105.1 hypothetical protein O2T12_22865 [Endozoicomonas sp. GU-1]WBA88669.1 hypothetical protein O3276_12040 [Endozoicomonas sp. GU-1]
MATHCLNYLSWYSATINANAILWKPNALAVFRQPLSIADSVSAPQHSVTVAIYNAAMGTAHQWQYRAADYYIRVHRCSKPWLRQS